MYACLVCLSVSLFASVCLRLLARQAHCVPVSAYRVVVCNWFNFPILISHLDGFNNHTGKIILLKMNQSSILWLFLRINQIWSQTGEYSTNDTTFGNSEKFENSMRCFILTKDNKIQILEILLETSISTPPTQTFIINMFESYGYAGRSLQLVPQKRICAICSLFMCYSLDGPSFDHFVSDRSNLGR